MSFGSWKTGLVCGVLLFAVLMIITILPLVASPPEPGAPLGPNDVIGAQMGALPAYVKIYMEVQHWVIAGSLFFVLWRREAQIYALGPVVSHIIFFAGMALTPIDKLTTSVAALSHWVWIVPLVVLIKAWPSIDKKTGFGVWATIAIGQMTISLAFDIPDGIMFLASLMS